MFRRISYPIIFFFLLSGLCGPLAFGQQNNTLYWMQGIPQSAYSNPSIIPDASWYIGIPGISSHYSGVSNSGFAFRDFLRKNQLGDFSWDEDYLLGSLNNHNILDGHMQHELLGFGWRSGDNYFSFSASENFYGSFAYPRDFMTLIIKGNDHFMQNNDIADLSGIAMEAMHYRQFAVGYAHHWNQVLSVGIRAKALMGLSNVWFEKTDFSLFTDPDGYGLLVNANMVVNTSLPVSLSPIDSLGPDMTFDFNQRDYLVNTSNMGFAIDFGLSWKPVESMTLAASITDFGFIDWRNGVENLSMNGEFDFQGVDLNDFINDDESMSFDNLLDSIKDIFDIEETTRAYRTPLNSRMIIAGAYDLNNHHKLGLLFKGQMFRGSLYPSYTFSYNYKPVRAFAVSLAYSVIHSNYHNVGAGMHVNMGPVQFYLAADNFLGMIQPHTMQSANIQLGLNLVFGYRDKARTSKPLFSW